MKKYNLKRFLASLLAVLMLASVTGVSPAVFAEDVGSTPSQEETVKPVLKDKSGEVLIKSSMTNEAVAELISKALISNYDQLDDTAKANLQWEYYCKGKEAFPGLLTNEGWGSINGFTTSKNIWGVNHTYYHDALKGTDEGSYQVRLAGTTTEATLVKVDKYSSKIVLKENASITYNMDAANMKEQIFNSAIDWENSVLPADAAIGDFTFEYKTLPSVADNIPLDKDKLEGLRQFAPVEGGKRDTWLDPLDYPMMGAGDQTIRVKFNGNGDYKASNVEDALKVEKANVTVTINDPIKVIYAGEKIDAKKYVSTDPADPALEIYIVYVGVNTNKESTIYLQVSGDKQNFIDGISDFQKEYLKYAEEDTLRGKLNDGITVGEFKEMLNGILSYVDNDFTKFLVNIALNKYGLTYDNLKDLLGALDKVSGIANNLRLAIGSPAHAGQYFAVAIAVNDNYNTGVSLPGSVTVLKNWKGVKLEKNPLFDAANNTITAKNNTITVSQAEKIAKSVCILTKDDEELDNSQTSVHYWFTGVNKIYAKNVMPTAPGRYIVTATVRGGDFFAMPKTFVFTIVPDPAPEVTPET